MGQLQTFEDIILLGIFLQFDVMKDVLRGRIRVTLRLNCYVILLVTTCQEPEECFYLYTIIRFPSPLLNKLNDKERTIETVNAIIEMRRENFNFA